MNLEDIMLNEISQSEKGKQYIIQWYEIPLKYPNSQRNRRRSEFDRAGEEEINYLMHIDLILVRWKSSEVDFTTV